MQRIVKKGEIKIINDFKKKIQKIKTARNDARSMILEKKHSMALSKQNEVISLLNKPDFIELKKAFGLAMLEIKKRIIENSLEEHFPEIMNYDFAYDPESSLQQLNKIEAEIKSTNSILDIQLT